MSSVSSRSTCAECLGLVVPSSVFKVSSCDALVSPSLSLFSLCSAVVLDLKGTQYTGRLLPGPTALVLSLAAATNNNFTKRDEATTTAAAAAAPPEPYLKVEGITDEFCSLTKTGDAMAKMNAVNQHGDYVPAAYYEEEDVNRTVKQIAAAATASDGATDTKAATKKRKRGPKSNAAAPAKKKATKSKK